MSINRVILLSICREMLKKVKMRYNVIFKKYNFEIFDFEFIDYLIAIQVNYNPLSDCNIIGEIRDWDNLPKEKTLFGSAEECGLPIGNLTSQLFSNVYLNKFDQFIKRELKCKHYGRYVDDSFIVSNSRIVLKRLIPEISKFLNEHLKLQLNEKKTKIYNAYHGVPFLGSYLLPFRKYMENGTLERIKKKIDKLDKQDPFKLQSQINSYLGVLSHNKSYCLRKIFFEEKFSTIGTFTFDFRKFYPCFDL